MNRACLFVSTLALAATGCVSTPVSVDAPQEIAAEAAQPASSSGSTAKLDAAVRKLSVARAKLEVARLEQDSYDQQHAEKTRQAQAALDMAEAKLARFADADAPHRLATEKLDLRTARDRAQEAADELAQIEIMYADQDLDDLTAEFVVSRGRRNAERAAARIEIQEAKLRALEERELPQERRRFELEVEKAAAALEAAAREGEIGRRGKAIAVQEAENTIATIESEIAELRESSGRGSAGRGVPR